MFLERKKTNKLAHVISMIHQRGRKKRSVVVENGVYSMEIHWTKWNDTISGSSGGLQPVKKGKTPLPPSGIPDPKHPRLLKDEGKACVCYPYYVTLRCIIYARKHHTYFAREKIVIPVVDMTTSQLLMNHKRFVGSDPYQLMVEVRMLMWKLKALI